MVDAHDSKSCRATCESSSLSSGTVKKQPTRLLFCIFYFATNAVRVVSSIESILELNSLSPSSTKSTA